MGLPGVKIGPLDPDSTQQFGQVSAKNSARQLIRLHAQAHPPELIRALARPLDPERTKGLDLNEVRDYLAGLKLENGDPLVPDGAVVVGAAVHGEPKSEQVLTFTFRQPSGRTAKWHAPYGEDVLPTSFQEGSALSQVREMKDRGVVAFDDQGAHKQYLEREAGELRRQVAALRSQLEARGTDDTELPPEVEGDTRAANGIVEDNERLGRENEDLKARNAQLEQLVGAAAPHGPQDLATVAAENPPVDGYDDLNAPEAVKLLKSEDVSDDDRRAILAYEKSHANRKTVVGAGEESLGARG